LSAFTKLYKQTASGKTPLMQTSCMMFLPKENIGALLVKSYAGYENTA